MNVFAASIWLLGRRNLGCGKATIFLRKLIHRITALANVVNLLLNHHANSFSSETLLLSPDLLPAAVPNNPLLRSPALPQRPNRFPSPRSHQMARFRKKARGKAIVKPVAKKNQPSVDQVTGEKVPKSFVFARGKLPGPLKQLKLDLRKLMLPYTALKLKEKKRNNLKDFLNVAGPMGVSHFLILSKGESVPYLRIARTPQGPTLMFKIHEYCLAADVARSQTRPRFPPELFKNSPLIVLSGFGTGAQHLKLTTVMFQNIFPAIDINTVKLAACQRIVLLNYDKDSKLIDFRHYSIRLQPVGVTHRLRKFVQSHQVPNLNNLKDVSEYVTRAGYGSESEADEGAATVDLAADIGRVNRASNKSAVKLQEIGPRMTLQLMKIEEGLCSGGVIFNEQGIAGGNQEEGAKE